MKMVEVLQDFSGANNGYDVAAYKKGDTVEISDSLFESVKEVRYYDKKKNALPVQYWVKEIKADKKENKKEKKEDKTSDR